MINRDTSIMNTNSCAAGFVIRVHAGLRNTLVAGARKLGNTDICLAPWILAGL